MFEKLLTIKGSAFNGCELLDNVILPEGLTTISNDAFEQCYEFGSATPDVNNYYYAINSNNLVKSSFLTVTITVYVTTFDVVVECFLKYHYLIMK